MVTEISVEATSATDAAPLVAGRLALGARLKRGLSFSTVGGLYVLLAMIVVFSIWVPETFPKWDTVRQILNNNSVAAMAALTLVVPLAAGVFDISSPHIMTLSGIMCTYTIVNTDLPIWMAIVIAMLTALLMGIVNSVVIVALKIDSLIGTLATGFIIQAVVKWRTGSKIVTSAELSDGGFSRLARVQWLTFTTPVFFTIVMAAIIWYLLEHTATGRRIYATGFNQDAARLAGVKADRIKVGSLMLASFFAGAVGVILASSIGSGSPTAGGDKLLPAFAGVFLGATQLKRGRFNAWGTIIGVVLLATGNVGLSLANQPGWIQDMFTGFVLIAALAVTSLQVRRAGAGGWRSRFGRGKPATPVTASEAAGSAAATS